MSNESVRDWADVKGAEMLPCAVSDITDITELCGTVSAADGQIVYGHNPTYCPAYFRATVAAALREERASQPTLDVEVASREIAEYAEGFLAIGSSVRRRSMEQSFKEIISRHFRADESRAVGTWV